MATENQHRPNDFTPVVGAMNLAEKVKKGEMTREKFNDCYGAWKAHAQQGNSFLLLQRMDAYVKSLFQGGETKNGTCEKVGDNSGTAP